MKGIDLKRIPLEKKLIIKYLNKGRGKREFIFNIGTGSQNIDYNFCKLLLKNLLTISSSGELNRLSQKDRILNLNFLAEVFVSSAFPRIKRFKSIIFSFISGLDPVTKRYFSKIFSNLEYMEDEEELEAEEELEVEEELEKIADGLIRNYVRYLLS